MSDTKYFTVFDASHACAGYTYRHYRRRMEGSPEHGSHLSAAAASIGLMFESPCGNRGSEELLQNIIAVPELLQVLGGLPLYATVVPGKETASLLLSKIVPESLPPLKDADDCNPPPHVLVALSPNDIVRVSRSDLFSLCMRPPKYADDCTSCAKAGVTTSKCYQKQLASYDPRCAFNPPSELDESREYGDIAQLLTALSPLELAGHTYQFASYFHTRIDCLVPSYHQVNRFRTPDLIDLSGVSTNIIDAKKRAESAVRTRKFRNICRMQCSYMHTCDEYNSSYPRLVAHCLARDHGPYTASEVEQYLLETNEDDYKAADLETISFFAANGSVLSRGVGYQEAFVSLTADLQRARWTWCQRHNTPYYGFLRYRSLRDTRYLLESASKVRGKAAYKKTAARFDIPRCMTLQEFALYREICKQDHTRATHCGFRLVPPPLLGVQWCPIRGEIHVINALGVYQCSSVAQLVYLFGVEQTLWQMHVRS